MSVRSSVAGVLHRLPFGIGTVVMVLCAVLIACVGVVLAIGTPPPDTAAHANGELRGYPHEPRVAWTLSEDALPGYGADTSPDVVDTWQDEWLVAYPSGLGRAFTLIDRLTGQPVWSRPIVAGLGDCAFNSAGQVACAIKLGSAPDGFYLVDGSGALGAASDLDDTATVTGVGVDYLRIDQAGYRATLRTAAGRQIWSRTFAASASARVTDGTLVIATTDGGQFAVRADTGRDLVSCTACSIVTYPTGIAVQYNRSAEEKVSTYATAGGVVQLPATSESADLQIVDGPSILPVLTGVGSQMIEQSAGRYEVRDPAQAAARWQVSDPELSRANTKPCGALLVLALKDRSRVIKTLADGSTVGRLPAPAFDQPDANIDYLDCVGSADDTVVFANSNQLTGFDVVAGRIAWTRNIIGSAKNVDGYLVLREGTSLTVLQPN